MFNLRYLPVLSVMAVTFCHPVVAQESMPCGNRDVIVERLTTEYGEDRIGLGLNNSNSLVELLISEETRSWTILVTDATGTTCLLAAGESWITNPSSLVKDDKV